MKLTVKKIKQQMNQLRNIYPENRELSNDLVSLKLDDSLAQYMADKYFYADNIQVKEEKYNLTNSEIKTVIKETFKYLGKWVYLFWFLLGVLVALLINKIF